MEDENITITKKQYDELWRDSDFLRALEAAGVDNWEGYDEAVRILKEMDTGDENT